MTDQPLDLSPAHWIWYPAGRVLPSTMVLFRRRVTLAARPVRALGWILADSRYALFVNGERVQRGPAPSDPRWPEADPLEALDCWREGENTLAVQVLYFGHGDGTWPIGKPGLLLSLELELANGQTERVVSDASWSTHLARSWAPGHYKRWYLRAFQEEFDARLYPFGWTGSTFAEDADWLPAAILEGRADRPALCHTLVDSLLGLRVVEPEKTSIAPRSIPLLREYDVTPRRLAEAYAITWRRPPLEYFESLVPDAFTAAAIPFPAEESPGVWRVEPAAGQSHALTFEFAETLVGWPRFIIDAPAGTTIEILVHQSHRPGGATLLNHCYHSWSRFICRGGENVFETFDYECCRWMQLHIHATDQAVTVRDVAIRRRIFPWPETAVATCSDPALNYLLGAALNTLHNSAQDIVVDCMGRERQQYSGDCGHQLHAIALAFGERRLVGRFVRTFSQGLTKDGYFMDCWPAYDRLARLMQRQIGLFHLGPILDHGVQFIFDCHHYYFQTGDLALTGEVFPRLSRFVSYLKALPLDDGLLPVDDATLGAPCVWIDYDAFRHRPQQHKQCAFTLYVAGMLSHAFAPLADVLGHTDLANEARQTSASLLAAAQKHFWDADRTLFIENKPWLATEPIALTSDRTLAMALLFDQIPAARRAVAVAMLADAPPEMGLSFPANAIWRLWALADAGRIDAVLRDLRERWATLPSVLENNSIQEQWNATYDSVSQWSHCAVGPLIIFFHGILGLRPLTPGFARCRLRPQLGDLADVTLTAHTASGPIDFQSHGSLGARSVTISLPPGCEAELVLDPRETVDFPLLRHEDSLAVYRLAVYRLVGAAVLTLSHT